MKACVKMACWRVLSLAVLTGALAIGSGPAAAAEHVVVRQGETAEALAARIGAAGAGPAILAHNGLAAGQPLVAGTVLSLPPEIGGREQDAAVLNIRGPVTATPAGGTATPLRPGASLEAGTLVCTGPDGHATVRLAVAAAGRDHDDVTLVPETCITIRSATSRSGRRASLIRLQQGSVAVPATDAGMRGGTLTVETEAGLTTAASGGFRVHVEPSASRTEALDTALSVVGAGVEQSLPAGFGSRTAVGEAPGAPVELLVAGTLLQPASGVPLRRPDFRWQPDPKALEYRVELATDPGFREMVQVEVSGLPQWQPARLMLPARMHELFWRVAPVDRLGFQGVPSQGRVLGLPSGVGE